MMLKQKRVNINNISHRFTISFLNFFPLFENVSPTNRYSAIQYICAQNTAIVSTWSNILLWSNTMLTVISRFRSPRFAAEVLKVQFITITLLNRLFCCVWHAIFNLHNKFHFFLRFPLRLVSTKRVSGLIVHISTEFRRDSLPSGVCWRSN